MSQKIITDSLISDTRKTQGEKMVRGDFGSCITKFLFSLCLVFFTLTVATYAQNDVKVSGIVVDDKGEPLIGATIQVRNETRGQIVGNDGKFEITVKPSDELIVSFLGYENQTLQVGDKRDFVVVMVSKDSELEEVVVAAFGKQKKSSVVSSIETIGAKDLRMPSSNLTAALAGRAAGLVALQKSGEPGRDNATFFIRGVTTFGYATSPLIILDGFEVSTSTLARVDPDNIENFSILKDATAAALYGSKGANGVIEVTTKKGREGRVKLMFRHESRISMPTQLPEFVDGVEYMKLYNEAEYTDNPNIGASYYSPQKIENTRRGLNPYAFPDIDWYHEMFNEAAYNQYYTMNLSGGGKAVNYYAAVSYTNESGLLKDLSINKYKNNIRLNRYNVLSNIDFKLTNTTKLMLNMSSLYEKTNGPGINPITSGNGAGFEIFRSVVNGNPVDFPITYQPDEFTRNLGHPLFGNSDGFVRSNPYASMVSGYCDGFNFNITSQFTLEQDLKAIMKGLSMKTKFSINNSGQYASVRSITPYYYTMKNYNETTGTYTLKEVQTGDDIISEPTVDRTANSHNYLESGIYYLRTFDKHDISAVVIYTQEEKRNTGSVGSSTTLETTLPSRNQAIRARVTYGYDNCYLFEASLTRQGSEKFYGSNKWGTFPAVAAGYTISNEDFWEPVRKAFSKMKLKASYGIVGNDNITSDAQRFFFLSRIDRVGWGYIWGENFNNGYNMYDITRYPNPDITWELAYKQNYGIELGVFNESIVIQLDRFKEKRTDIYMQREGLPASMGLTASISGNSGKAESKGWDGSVDIKHNFNKDFWMTGRFNFTYSTNKILKIDEKQYKDAYLSRVGLDMDQVHGYIAERLFIDQPDIDNSPLQQIGTGIIRPGDIKYKDINSDGVVDENDRVPLGLSRTPGINYGFGISTGYKNFDFSCFFQGIANVSFYMAVSDFAPFYNYRNALKFVAEDHWSPNNPVAQAQFPRLTTSYNNNNYYQYSTWWMRNGALLRLKTLEIGYTIPVETTKKIKAETLRFYLSGQNLFCIKSFDLWDPEMGSSGLGYPLQRVYSIGLNMNF